MSTSTMQAIVQEVYGSPDVLHFAEVPRPQPGPRDLLVRVRAVSVNPVDTKIRRGGPANTPVPGGPKILGWDASGVVEAVGADVTHFTVGDPVFFAGDITRAGSYAQYVAVDERIVGRKPATLSHAEAAAVPLVALTAWEGIIETLGARHTPEQPEVPLQSILIVGGAGGVGSIAVQIAKRVCGLVVVATTSRPETTQFCVQMGADWTINHHHDFALQLHACGLHGVDFILNTASLANLPQLIASLNPLGKICAIVGGDELKAIDVSGLFPIRGSLAFELMFTRPRLGVAPERQGEILNQIAHLLDARTLTSTMTQSMPWHEVRDAHHAVESGRMIGKLVMMVD